jgi:hypothetical protein
MRAVLCGHDRHGCAAQAAASPGASRRSGTGFAYSFVVAILMFIASGIEALALVVGLTSSYC